MSQTRVSQQTIAYWLSTTAHSSSTLRGSSGAKHEMGGTGQWCSRDCNLRDRDLVKISRRYRDFIKNSETPDLKFETETRDFKICTFCPEFLKKCRHYFWLAFFSNFWHFPDIFWLFLSCKYNKQKLLNYKNFTKPFLCNIQGLETWNLRDRDSQKCVSRPRPSLETPITGTEFKWGGWAPLASPLATAMVFRWPVFYY